MHSIKYGNKRIEFSLEHAERKTLQINVCPDLRVEVKAPRDAELDKVMSRVRKRAGWIVKQQRYFTQFLPLQPPRRFISGETHRYLGRQYRLKTFKSSECEVKMSGGFINVYLPAPKDSRQIAELLTGWYRARAERVFNAILADNQAILNKLDVTAPRVRIRFMRTRWGSCSKNGQITLNSELIKAPKSCIRYVLVHELCHLKEYHHNKDFYNLLEKCLPNWKLQKEKLSQMADLIL